ncbi:riboflavin synthase, partial [Candidatus Pacearchaeota archaeon]
TVNKILSSKIFSLKLVPYTLTHTNFINRKIGDLVNIEFDILGKYIYEFISQIKKFR